MLVAQIYGPEGAQCVGVSGWIRGPQFGWGLSPIYHPSGLPCNMGWGRATPVSLSERTRGVFWDIHTKGLITVTSLLGCLLCTVSGFGAGQGICDNLVFLSLPSPATCLGLEAEMRRHEGQHRWRQASTAGSGGR